MYRVYYIGGIKTDGTKATDDRAGENEKESTDSKKEKEDIDSENQTYVLFCCVFIFARSWCLASFRKFYCQTKI